MNPQNSSENPEIDELDLELEVRTEMDEYFAPGRVEITILRRKIQV